MAPHNLHDDDDRRLAAVGGLVRLQRRLRARSRTTPPRSRSSTRYLATACAVLSWMFGEWMFKGKPSMLGAASGAVAGLVAITPAAGNVGIPGAFVIGLARRRRLPVGRQRPEAACSAPTTRSTCSACTRVGGILGALLTGVFDVARPRRPGLRHRLGHRQDRLPGLSWRSCDPGEGRRHHDRLDGRGRVHRLQDRRPHRRPARHRRRGARRSRHQRRTASRPTACKPQPCNDCARDGRPLAAARKLGAPPRAHGSLSSVAIRGAPHRRPVFCGASVALALQSRACRSDRRMVPHLTTALTGPLLDLERRILDRMPEIERWLRTQWQEHAVAVLRVGRPAQRRLQARAGRHQSLPRRLQQPEPAFLPLCVQAIQAAVERVCPDARGVLLDPGEPHAQHVLPAERRDAAKHPAPGRHARAHRLAAARDHRSRPTIDAARRRRSSRSSRSCATAGAWASATSTRAWCCSTTICRPASPAILQDIDQPVVPPLARGLVQPPEVASLRRVSATWREEFAALLGIDPWLIDPVFRRLRRDQFPGARRRGMPRIATSATLLERHPRQVRANTGSTKSRS